MNSYEMKYKIQSESLFASKMNVKCDMGYQLSDIWDPKLETAILPFHLCNTLYIVFYGKFVFLVSLAFLYLCATPCMHFSCK